MEVAQLLLQQQQWQMILAILLLLPLASLLLLGRKRSSGSGLSLPPGPWMLPIVGNLHQIGRLPHQSMSALARRHGPVMMLRLGMMRTVVLSSPEAAREALKANDKDCSSRPLSAGPGLLTYGHKDVVFSPWSDYVREMRKLFVVELLSNRCVKAAYHARETQIERLVEELTIIGPNPVPIGDHVFAAMDRIVSLFAFGDTEAGQQFKGQLVPLLYQTTDILGGFSAQDFFPNVAGRIVSSVTGTKARREKVFRELDSLFEHIIQEYDDPAKPGGASDLLQALVDVDLMKRPPAAGTTTTFTKDNVKAILLNTFVAATDTTAITVNWAMTELIRNPRVLRKAQQEIRAATGGGGKERVQQADMPKLRYLRMVFSETLRLHPPATLLVPRETVRPIRVAGYNIPGKTTVLVNVWAIGRDPSVWKDPEDFNPERFENIDVDYNGGHFELLPFGTGRRICPGMAMAVANSEFMLANLLYCFNWELPDGLTTDDVDMEEDGELTIRKKTPLLLVPTRYNPKEH